MYLLLLAICVLTYFLYALKQHLTYWEQNGVPQYTVTKILKDHFLALFKKKALPLVFHSYCTSFQNKRYFGIYQLFKRSLVIHDPELVKKITIKDFDHFVDHELFSTGNDPLWDKNLFALHGKAWKDMRMILSPTFTGRKMRLMFELMLKCSDQFVKHLEKLLEQRICVEVDVRDVYNKFVNDVISSIAFGYECDSLQNPNNIFFTNSRLALPQHTFLDNFKLFLILNVPKVARFFRLKFYGNIGGNFFLDIMRKDIKERKNQGIVRHDIINLLMKAQNTRNLNDVDITAQALLFFFAGTDTVSALLVFMSYELALRQDIQKRLQNEVDDTLKNCEGVVTYDVIKTMKYMDMVVSESLRKWPTAVTTDRVCTKPYVIQPENLGEVPVHLKKGDLLWIPMYSIHRNLSLYPNPEDFDPERFNEQNKENFKSYGYIPFGSGPRVCIANRFAKAEIKLLFLQILSKFDIVTVDSTSIPLQFANYSTQMFPEEGFVLGFKRRTGRE